MFTFYLPVLIYLILPSLQIDTPLQISCHQLTISVNLNLEFFLEVFKFRSQCPAAFVYVYHLPCFFFFILSLSYMYLWETNMKYIICLTAFWFWINNETDRLQENAHSDRVVGLFLTIALSGNAICGVVMRGTTPKKVEVIFKSHHRRELTLIMEKDTERKHGGKVSTSISRP